MPWRERPWDGPSASTLKDNTEMPISPTDLTSPARFKKWRGPPDLYRTLMTGLLGTPMPSYADSLEPEQAWDRCSMCSPSLKTASLLRPPRDAEAIVL